MSTASSGNGLAVVEPIAQEGDDKGDHADSKDSLKPVPTEEAASDVEMDGKDAAAAAPDEPSDSPAPPRTDPVSFKVIYNKQKYDVDFFLDSTIANLKTHLEKIIDVPASMQKIMVKGLAKDEKTLRETGINPSAKVLVVGSTFKEVLDISQPAPKPGTLADDKGATASKEPLCEQKAHQKIIAAGPPEDAMPGIKNSKEHLPAMPLSGMVNKHGGKIRLTFKMEVDQIWFGTKERTEKINMSSVKTIVSEPIKGHEQYHIMGFQLGPTEASRYWVYWVPAQYVDAIKDTVLGNWQYF